MSCGVCVARRPGRVAPAPYGVRAASCPRRRCWVVSGLGRLVSGSCGVSGMIVRLYRVGLRGVRAVRRPVIQRRVVRHPSRTVSRSCGARVARRPCRVGSSRVALSRTAVIAHDARERIPVQLPSVAPDRTPCAAPAWFVRAVRQLDRIAHCPVMHVPNNRHRKSPRRKRRRSRWHARMGRRKAVHARHASADTRRRSMHRGRVAGCALPGTGRRRRGHVAASLATRSCLQQTHTHPTSPSSRYTYRHEDGAASCL